MSPATSSYSDRNVENPAALLELSEAFSRSLEAINLVQQQQLSSIAGLTDGMLRAALDLAARAEKASASSSTIVELKKAVESFQGKAVETKEAAAAGLATAAKSIAATTNAPGAPPNLYDAAVQALSNALHNAVNAQQQVNITAQAAFTICVQTMVAAANTGIRPSSP